MLASYLLLRENSMMSEFNIRSDPQIENTHIRELSELVSPHDIKAAIPASEVSIATVLSGREAVRATISPNRLNKLTVITGPCSIHDVDAALEYADWLRTKREEHGNQLEIIMRMYIEKPRTTIGWKGLINDPNLDESFNINKGLHTVRKLASDITNLGIPV